MAIQLGTENKRNVIIFGVLLCAVVGIAGYELFGGPSTPAPRPAPPAATVPASPAGQSATSSAAKSTGSAAGQQAKLLPSTGLDPSLHLDKLALSESIEYAGSGRNIFSGEAAAPVMDRAAAPARPSAAENLAALHQPPPTPQPPAIDLRYFGYTATRDGKREAFLLRGEDIFEAAAGEIVNHRYKVVTVDARSVQITDLSYNNTQTLPLVAN